MKKFAAVSGTLMSFIVLVSCNNFVQDADGGSVSLSESVSGTPYGAYKSFTCSVRGNAPDGRREMYTVSGKYKLHEIGGQYEIENPVVLRDDGVGKSYAIALEGINSAPILPNHQTFFSGKNANFHLNIQVTTNVRKDFQIKADVSNQNSSFRQLGDCNFQSIIVSQNSSIENSSGSQYECRDAEVNPGGHRYSVRLQQHPKNINSHFEHFVEVTRADGTVTRVAVLLSRADSDYGNGTRVLIDKSRRIRLTLYSVHSMGNSFRASLSHEMKRPSVEQDVTARPVLNCSALRD